MPGSGVCSSCGRGNVAVAEFCRFCGQPLGDSPATVGRVSHPNPISTPDGYRRVNSSADLYFQVGSAWGGRRLLATENLGLTFFNAGFSLKEVEISVDGYDKSGGRLFELPRAVESLDRGERLSIEVPSYDIPEPPHEVDVRLVEAKYA